MFISLIHTCDQNGVNSFDYLGELQPHAADLAAAPADWMPWIYSESRAQDVYDPVPQACRKLTLLPRCAHAPALPPIACPTKDGFTGLEDSSERAGHRDALAENPWNRTPRCPVAHASTGEDLDLARARSESRHPPD